MTHFLRTFRQRWRLCWTLARLNAELRADLAEKQSLLEGGGAALCRLGKVIHDYEKAEDRWTPRWAKTVQPPSDGAYLAWFNGAYEWTIRWWDHSRGWQATNGGKCVYWLPLPEVPPERLEPAEVG